MVARGRFVVSLLIAAGFVLAGCATSDEWRTWKEHRTHFASGEHLSFSVKNPEGTAPRVSRTDVVKAVSEGWWGKPVTVSQESIVTQ